MFKRGTVWVDLPWGDNHQTSNAIALYPRRNLIRISQDRDTAHKALLKMIPEINRQNLLTSDGHPDELDTESSTCEKTVYFSIRTPPDREYQELE